MAIDFEKVFEEYALEYCKSFYGCFQFATALDKAIYIAFDTKYFQTGSLFEAYKYATYLRERIRFEIENYRLMF